MRRLLAISLVLAMGTVNASVAAQPSKDPGLGRQWSLAKVAESTLRGSPSIVVAVLDTGITAHPDLGWRITPNGVGRPGGAVLAGYDFLSDPWRSQDGDGWDPDPSDLGDGVRAADAAEKPGCKPRVSSWHGTNVAGTIGAIGNNGRGITGIASGVRLLPVRILGRCGGSTADVAAAILWAAGEPVVGIPLNDHPAQVINVSLSGESARCPRALQTAIDVATERGASVVVAAGSAAANTRTQTPANCSGVIVVGATDRQDRRSPTSNFGTEVTVSAPGGNMSVRETDGIYTTANTGRYGPRRATYGYYQGSSAATAHVSGIIANLLSKQPGLTPDEVFDQITDPSVLTPFTSGQCDVGDGLCGAGIVRLETVFARVPSSQ